MFDFGFAHIKHIARMGYRHSWEIKYRDGTVEYRSTKVLGRKLVAKPRVISIIRNP